MLFRKDKTGLIALTQPHHAWLSGQLARVWGNADFEGFEPYEEVCLGAENHDIGWVDWEKSPTLNPQTGYPYAFLELPREQHLGIWSKAGKRALVLGQYPALVVSLHGTWLFETFRSLWENSEYKTRIENYLKQEKLFQNQIIENLQKDSKYSAYVTPEIISRNQRLVATWDNLSLAICMGINQEQVIEYFPTSKGIKSFTLTPMDGIQTRIQIHPWPFRENEVNLIIEGKRFTEKFTDQEKMRRYLENTEPTHISIQLRPMKNH